MNRETWIATAAVLVALAFASAAADAPKLAKPKVITTDVFFDEAMKWMRAQAGAKQLFFCYVATAAAHGPLYVPQKIPPPLRGVPEIHDGARGRIS